MKVYKGRIPNNTEVTWSTRNRQQRHVGRVMSEIPRFVSVRQVIFEGQRPRYRVRAYDVSSHRRYLVLVYRGGEAYYLTPLAGQIEREVWGETSTSGNQS